MTQVLASCDRCSWQLVTTSEALAQLLLQKHHQLQHRQLVATTCPLCRWGTGATTPRLGWLELVKHYQLRHREAELPEAPEPVL